MSDMEQSDVPADVAPVAPEAVVEADAPPVEPVAPDQASAHEDVPADAGSDPVAEAPVRDPGYAGKPPEATPVVARQPSSASPTQQPESAPEVEKAPLPLEDAVSVLLIFVKGRRTVGDSDLDAAVADVEAALAAQNEQA